MRDSWIDVLCCHLVLSLRHGFVHFSGNEETKAVQDTQILEQLLICIIKQMHLWHLDRIPLEPSNLTCFTRQQLTSLFLTGKALAFYPGGTWFKSKLTGQQNAPLRIFLQLPSGQGSVGMSHPPGGTVWSECLAYYFSFGRRYKGVRQLFFFFNHYL